jgi:hypothetical protein
MFVSALSKRIRVVLAVAALCATAAGCISDMAAPTVENSGNGQMRCYGGPKYPMWSAQSMCVGVLGRLT